MNRIGAQLLAMALVLARAAADTANPQAGDLAEAFCARARRRVSDLWNRLDEDGRDRRRRVMDAVHDEYVAAALLDGLIT
jgi:hypothetical protein